MTENEREELEVRAERCLRRGELSLAFSLFEQVIAAFPNDHALAQRVRDLKEQLQPAEMSNPTSNFRATQPTPMQEAEIRASRGDFLGAIAIYRAVLEVKPDNELIKERLLELTDLARATAGPPLTRRHSQETTLAEILSRIDARKRG